MCENTDNIREEGSYDLADYLASCAHQIFTNGGVSPLPDDIEIGEKNEFGFPVIRSKSARMSMEVIIFDYGLGSDGVHELDDKPDSE